MARPTSLRQARRLLLLALDVEQEPEEELRRALLAKKLTAVGAGEDAQLHDLRRPC
ncbi:hypothetical protein [Mycolicibacterium goodii]|uniref:hypothetical protein n=1 Tax=Mycolicibacterium goodii TaxID=134601 RepID=UPI001BDD6372|nr:hypothetical protein [Mycolicibacterium goodii]MBU8829262.1 hypothetical protein [Mycolicibacterium goodii]